MKSLTDYILFEDEDKFVKIEYKTSEEVNDGKDSVQLANPMKDDINKELGDKEGETDVKQDDILPGGVDQKLVGELRLYSETSSLFNERKRLIANAFKSKLKDSEVNANRVKFTKIFDYYIIHLIQAYKKNVDENIRLNISSKEELKRQLADDLVMVIKNMEILPQI